MAVVLNSEENTYFSSGPLRRSHSQPKFVTTQPSYTSIPCRSMSSSNGFRRFVTDSASVETLEKSLPRKIHSYASYSLLSDDESSSDHCGMSEDGDQINFPSYDDVGYYGHSDDMESSTSSQTEASYTVSPTLSPTSNSTSTNISRPQSPDLIEHAEDDTAIRIQPSRHVDYLSHNWREEEIWLSWKHVVSRRKAYNNSARLENASWRSWIKAKYKLKTVSPETLNWLKDCDVTWLYGPLQTGGSEHSFQAPSPSPSSYTRLSKTNSFLSKKPILKKRSMSELMLQKSLSTSSLLKQAAAAIQAQQSEKAAAAAAAATQDTTPSYICPFSPRRPSDLGPRYFSSISSSDLPSPVNGDKKRIHFNEQVEQCIALDVKGDDDDDDDDQSSLHEYGDSDSDDDDGIMMKLSTTKRKLALLQRRRTTRPSPSQESKTIAMLPSTTLKYRPDTPDSFELATESSNEFWDGRMLSPSPSQETLKPSKSSKKMLICEVDDEEDEDDIDWQPSCSFPNHKDSVVVAHERLKGSPSAVSLKKTTEDEFTSLRRTSSGMFMPYDENENIKASEGFFSRVVDTVNTAKDIAHVIWNVGWRR